MNRARPRLSTLTARERHQALPPSHHRDRLGCPGGKSWFVVFAHFRGVSTLRWLMSSCQQGSTADRGLGGLPTLGPHEPSTPGLSGLCRLQLVQGGAWAGPTSIRRPRAPGDL